MRTNLEVLNSVDVIITTSIMQRARERIERARERIENEYERENLRISMRIERIENEYEKSLS